MNGDTIYDNSTQGAQIPSREEILQEIRRYREPLPGTGEPDGDAFGTEIEDDAIACPWPPPPPALT
jgi:hypothetical protein